jgi:hypothetical protein
MQAASEIQDIPSAFRWFIANHHSKHPASPPRFIRVVTDKSTCSENECAPNENVVTVYGPKFTFWYRPYSQPGAPSFAAWQLDGLFDVLRAVVWRRMIDEWKVDRFLAEKELDDVGKAAVRRYDTLKQEGKRLTHADIESLLLDRETLRCLYRAARTSDSHSLELCVNQASNEVERVGIDHVRDLIRTIGEGNEESTKSARTFLIFRILQCALENLPMGDQLNWRGSEYRQNVDDTYEQVKTLGRLATSWYAKQFERICLSEEVLDLGKRLFFDRSPGGQQEYRSCVSSFVNEVLSSPERAA